MFMYTQPSATKRFTMYGGQTQMFCHKKMEKMLPNSSQTDYSAHSSKDQMDNNAEILQAKVKPGNYLKEKCYSEY